MRKLLSQLLALVLFLPIAFVYYPQTARFRPAYAEPERPPFELSVISGVEIDVREEGLEMDGILPHSEELSGLDSEAINERINEITERKIIEARESIARVLYFSYEATFSEPILSILIGSSIVSETALSNVVSLNFDVERNQFIDLGEILGAHGLQLFNGIINEMIRRNPQVYNSAWSGLQSTQSFILLENSVVIWFNHIIADGSEATSLVFDLDNMFTVELAPEDYYVMDAFNLKMLPLRRILESFPGYNVVWNEERRTASVYYRGAFLTELTPGSNIYQIGRVSRILEAAPALINGVLHAPISFFDHAVEFSARSVERDGTVVFAIYQNAEEWLEKHSVD